MWGEVPHFIHVFKWQKITGFFYHELKTNESHYFCMFWSSCWLFRCMFCPQDRRYADLTEEQLPSCESLKDTIARALPYWNNVIAPQIKQGKRVLIAAHGNSLRGIVKHLEGVRLRSISETLRCLNSSHCREERVFTCWLFICLF